MKIALENTKPVNLHKPIIPKKIVLESKTKEQVALENKSKQNQNQSQNDKGFFDVPNKKREFDENDLDENSYRSTKEDKNKDTIPNKSMNNSKPILGENMNGK